MLAKRAARLRPCELGVFACAHKRTPFAASYAKIITIIMIIIEIVHRATFPPRDLCIGDAPQTISRVRRLFIRSDICHHQLLWHNMMTDYFLLYLSVSPSPSVFLLVSAPPRDRQLRPCSGMITIITCYVIVGVREATSNDNKRKYIHAHTRNILNKPHVNASALERKTKATDANSKVINIGYAAVRCVC